MIAKLCLATLAALSLSSAASAQDAPLNGPTPLEQLRQAHTFLKTAIAEADAADGAPPTVANSDTSDQVKAAFNLEALAELPELDINRIQQVCDLGNGEQTRYLQFGLRHAGISQAQTEEENRAAALVVIKQNALRFQDEVALASRFVIACYARMMPAITAFAEALPPSEWTDVRKQGVAQLRHGTVQFFVGVIRTQSDPIRQPNRRLVLDEALKDVEIYAAAMQPGDRKVVIQAIDAVDPKSSVTSSALAKLKKMRAAMAIDECTGLCRF